MTMNRIALLVRNVAEIVHRLANHVHDATERAFTDRYGYWPTGVSGFHAAHHPVSWQHRDCAHAPFAKMLLHFGDDVDWFGHIEAIRSYPQSFINRRQVILTKLNVNHRADDLHDATYVSVRAASIRRSHISSINSFGLMRSLYRQEPGKIVKIEKVTQGFVCRKVETQKDAILWQGENRYSSVRL